MIYVIVGIIVVLLVTVKVYQIKNNKLEAKQSIDSATLANATLKAQSQLSQEKLDAIDAKIKATVAQPTDASFFNDRYGKGDK